MKEAIVLRQYEHYTPGSIVTLSRRKFAELQIQGKVKEYQKIKALTGKRPKETENVKEYKKPQKSKSYFGKRPKKSNKKEE